MKFIAKYSIVVSATLFFVGCQTSFRQEASDITLAQRTPKTSYLVGNLNIITMEEKEVLKNQVVLIENGLISKIHPMSQLSEEELSDLKTKHTFIDGKGRFLLPGLIDAHAHIGTFKSPELARIHLRLYLLNGVTSIRDLSGTPQVLKFKRKINDGVLLGPRIFSSGPIYHGTGESSLSSKDSCFKYNRWSCSVSTPKFASQRVKVDKKNGFDAIKVREEVSRDSYLAFAKAAKAEGIDLVGHYPQAISYKELFEKNYQHSIEHPSGFPVESDASPYRNNPDPWITHLGIRNHYASLDKEDDLIKSFASSNTFFVPTLAAFKGYENLILYWSGLKNTMAPKWDYIDACWKEDKKKYQKTYVKAKKWLNLDGVNFVRKGYSALERLVRKAWKEGVPIVTGSDHNVGFSVAGFSIHDELEALVQAGLKPEDSLKSATLQAARLLNVKNIGVVRVGAIADLVIVDENPLHNIKASKGIFGVFSSGRWLNRSNLDNIASQSVDLIRKSNCK